MRQCEKMLLVLQISLWLNDNSVVLQSLTRCYGLVAPLLQMKIPSKPVLQVGINLILFIMNTVAVFPWERWDVNFSINVDLYLTGTLLP